MIPVRKTLGFHKILFKVPFFNFANTIVNSNVTKRERMTDTVIHVSGAEKLRL